MRAGAVLLLAALAACADRGPGSVAGDVFVVLDTGEEVNAAGVPVRLLPDHARSDTALARLCAARRDDLSRAGGAEDARGAALERGWEARGRLLEGEALAAAATEADARFRMDGVPPGRYRVWTDAVVQGERWSWTEPVEVRGGDTVRVSLGNHNADEDPFRCELLREMEEGA
jgi:hypothetical protein